MHTHAMIRDSSRFHGALAVLAPPKRFRLLLLMLEGVDRSVSQLAAAVGLSQSCTTRHLQALARAGLVKGVRDGKRVVFRVAPRDEAARGVLASLAAAEVGAESPAPRGRRGRRQPRARPGKPPASNEDGEGARSVRARRSRRARREYDAMVPSRILGAVIHIDSAAELEPPVDSPLEPESAINSEPSDPPAWRRGDLEDFLL